jgi:hypothetical protein
VRLRSTIEYGSSPLLPLLDVRAYTAQRENGVAPEMLL